MTTHRERTAETATTDSGQERPAAAAAAVSAPPVTARAAAEVAGVSERTIRRAIARGDLPATKHAGAYRIAPDDLTLWATAASGHERTAATPDTPDRTAAAERTAATPDTGPDAAATLAPLAEVIAHQGAEIVRLSAAAAVWQERARVLEDRLLALGSGEIVTGPSTASPAPQGEAEPANMASDTSHTLPSRWRRWVRSLVGS